MAELFPGHDDLRPDAVRDLVHAKIALHFEGGLVRCSFDEETMSWDAAQGFAGLPATGSAPYEAIPVRRGILAATAQHPETRATALLVIDLAYGRCVVVFTQMIEGEEGVEEVTRLFDAAAGKEIEEPFRLSADLVGRRIFWRYSETHTFEHIYLDEHIYCWHGITGPEAGMGGVEPASARLIADDLYLFTWSDTSVPFSGAILVDLAEAPDAKSAGRLVGWDGDKQQPWQIIVGAHGTLLNETSHVGL